MEDRGWHYLVRVTRAVRVKLDDGVTVPIGSLISQEGDSWEGEVSAFKKAGWLKCWVAEMPRRPGLGLGASGAMAAADQPQPSQSQRVQEAVVGGVGLRGVGLQGVGLQGLQVQRLELAAVSRIGTGTRQPAVAGHGPALCVGHRPGGPGTRRPPTPGGVDSWNRTPKQPVQSGIPLLPAVGVPGAPTPLPLKAATQPPDNPKNCRVISPRRGKGLVQKFLRTVNR